MTDKVPDKHQPSGATWTCEGCGAFWPCEPAQAQLVADLRGDRVVLALYMASTFLRATRDMPETPTGILYGRFLGWVR
jgi:hypothetical protein